MEMSCYLFHNIFSIDTTTTNVNVTNHIAFSHTNDDPNYYNYQHFSSINLQYSKH